jgi:hypothetical protein
MVMAEVLVITPVKNSIATTLETAMAISKSTVSLTHKIFNDFSEEKTKLSLEEHAPCIGYDLVHLEEFTNTPSPNYKMVLQMAQKEAIEKNLPLLIIESDVVVKNNTIEGLLRFYEEHPKAGLIGAITQDENGQVNFPYQKFKDITENVINTGRSLSFCCTLISQGFLEKYDFKKLDASKHWYDTHISHKSLEFGFQNFIMMNVPVLHRPHASRPWKILKYKNPFKYYLTKYLYGKDKI